MGQESQAGIFGLGQTVRRTLLLVTHTEAHSGMRVQFKPKRRVSFCSLGIPREYVIRISQSKLEKSVDSSRAIIGPIIAIPHALHHS
jgi:hypothetical protein